MIQGHYLWLEWVFSIHREVHASYNCLLWLYVWCFQGHGDIQVHKEGEGKGDISPEPPNFKGPGPHEALIFTFMGCIFMLAISLFFILPALSGLSE